MTEIQSLSKLIETFFNSKQFDLKPKELYEPINYIMSTGGKRIRSILTLLGYQGYSNDIEMALPLAYSTELFHNFTLVHDDIMDDAPIRRGKKTVHEKYDTNTAILSGDVMHAQVVKVISELDHPSVLEIIKRFCATSILVCEGQSEDMSFENREEVGMLEYLEMIENKTAVLIGYALESGGLLAGATVSQAKHLYDFGRNAGIAFQLQDDYLDLYGESFKVGKQKCGDIIQKKKNYFHVKAMELLEGDEKRDFSLLYNSDKPAEQRVDEVLAVYKELYLKNYLAESKSAFMDLAYSHLENSGYEVDKRDQLKSMAKSLADRSQ